MTTIRKAVIAVLSAFAVVLLALFPARPTYAAEAVLSLPQGMPEKISAYPWLYYYDPGLQSPDIEEVINLPANQWRPAKKLPLDIVLNPRRTLWFHLHIENPDRQPYRLALQNTNPATDRIETFISKDHEFLPVREAVRGPEGSHSSFFTVAAQSSMSVYLKITGFHSAFIPLSLYSEANYLRKKHIDGMLAGITNGMLLGLVIYNLMLGIKTRQKMYFAYLALGTATIFTTVTHQSTLGILFPDLIPTVKPSVTVVSSLLPGTALVFFIQAFLETARHFPLANRYFNGYMIAIIVMIAAFLLNTPVIITTPLFIMLSSIASILMFYCCLASRHLDRLTILLTITGIAMPMMLGAVSIAMSIGATPLTLSFTELVQLAHVLEMLALSLAMASRIRQQQEEHQQQARAANEARIISEAHNRLIAHLNHELRTPLNGIVGAAEILLQKSSNHDRQIFNMIHHTAIPLKHLVDDMVNITAISENRKPVQKIRFDLQALLQECMDIFIPASHQKNIRLFFLVDQNVATDVTGDPYRIRQILLNLVGNACKFTSHGEVGIHVSRLVKLDSGGYLYHFEVIDTGTGISSEDQQKLFRTFETTHKASGQPGTGLGLSIVRELSQLLGGDCGYSGNSTAGSTFWFSAELLSHGNATRIPHQALEDLDILIADEDRIMAEHLARHVRLVASSTETVHTAGELAERIRQKNFDIVIAHHSMVDGTELTSIIEKNPNLYLFCDENETISLKPGNLEIHVRKTSIEKFTLQIAESLIRTGHVVSARQQASYGKFRRMLVAEDILTNQNVIRAILESMSIKADVCSNGKAAFELFTQNHTAGTPYDAILMDCEMPLQDGFETTRQIRRHELANQLPATPVIALTAHTEPAYRLRSQQSGMDVYLTKPITLNSIRLCLHNLERKPS